MQLNRCPICHHRISLDALAQDESGREMLALLAKQDNDFGTALIGYLSLFRSKSRDLANDKALRLAKEVLNLSGQPSALTQAMNITVDQLRTKATDPLTNHNYLKKVLGDCHGFKPDIAKNNQIYPVITKPPTSKTAQALQALENYGSE